MKIEIELYNVSRGSARRRFTMGVIKTFLDSIKRAPERDIASGEKIIAAKLKRLLDDCPICKSGFAAHRYARFATTVLTRENESRARDFQSSMREHRWTDAIKFSEF